MRRSGLAATAALVTWCAGFGGAAGTAQGQNLGGDGIVIVGADLSGQWDFTMRVIGRSDPAIPATDTLAGSFTVTGGAPTYSGSGTFNGLPATISGTAEVVPGSDPASFSITLRDHIASKDSETHFTGQLFGDLGAGAFTGATLDGSATWAGVFDIKIMRPTTQTPEEQIESAASTSASQMADVLTESQSAVQSLVQRSKDQYAHVLTVRGFHEALAAARGALSAIRSAAIRVTRTSLDSFRVRSSEILASAPLAEKESLRRLIAEKSGLLEQLEGSTRSSVMQGSSGDVILPDGPPGELIRQMNEERDELNQLKRWLVKAKDEAKRRSPPLPFAHAVFLEAETFVDKFLGELLDAAIPKPDQQKMQKLLNALLPLLQARKNNQLISNVDADQAADTLLDLFGTDAELTNEQKQEAKAQIANILQAVFIAMKPEDAAKKYTALSRMAGRLDP